MKLLIKIVGGLLFLLLVFVVLIPLIFKDDIVQIVKDEANKTVNANVEFGNFDLTLISSFPDLTFVINDVKVSGKAPFEGIDLANIRELTFTIDVKKVIVGSQISVKQFALSDADFTIKTLDDGRVNYDIALANDEQEVVDEESSSDMKFALQSYAFNNVNFVYDDAVSDLYAELSNFNHNGTGDFTMEVFLLETKSTIEKMTMKYEGISYFKNTKTSLDMNIDMDMTSFKFTFKNTVATLNGLNLTMDGWLAMPGDDIDMDLSFNAPDNDFKSLLSLIPAVYSKDFEAIETSGNFTFNSSFKGTYNDNQMPAFNIGLIVNNCRFNYPDLPKSAENINIDLAITNPDGIEDNTVVELKKFHVELGDNPLDFSMKLIKPVSDPYFVGQIQSQINFESLAEVVPLDEGMRFGGTVTADAAFEGAMSALENEQYVKFKASGNMILTGFEYNDPQMDYPLNIKAAYLSFSPELINLSAFEMLLGKSDVKLKGTLSNYLPYYLNDETLVAKLDFNSTNINADELMGEEEAAEAESDDSIEEDYTLVEIPKNLDINFTAFIGNLLYDGMEMKKLNGLLSVKDGAVNLTNFGLNMMEGSVNMTGVYKMDLPTSADADFSLDVVGFDIQQTFKTFNTIQKLAPIAEHAKGKFSTKFAINTKLMSNMEPDMKTVNAKGNLQTINMVIEGSKMMKKAADVLKNDKYGKMDLKNTNITFSIQNGTITTEPFDLTIAGKRATISGESNLNQELNYLISTEVPKSDFGAAAAKTMTGLLSQVKSKTGVDLNGSDNLDLELVVGGTFTEPTVKPRVAGIIGGDDGVKEAIDDFKEEVKEKVEEKIEEVKEDVNKKIAEERAKLVKAATQKGDQLIAGAEKQAANLNKQATAGSDKIIEEAKAKTDKLYKEAGSNPIKKKAAELAAGKINKEVAKKAQVVIGQGDAKGKALIEKAELQKQNLIKEAKNKEIKI